MIQYDDFLERLSSIPIFDTHEHLQKEEQALEKEIDFFDLLIPYICDDLLSSGMSKEEWEYINNKTIDLEKRWEVYSKYHQFIENGGYFLTVKRIFKQYGLNEIDLKNIKKISESLSLKRKAGYYSSTLKDLGIKKVNVILGDYKVDEGFDNFSFPQIPTVSKFCPTCFEDLEKIMQYCDCSIKTTEDIKVSIGKLFGIYKRNNIHALKIGSGYVRELDFMEPDEIKAQNQLDAIYNGDKCTLNSRQIDNKYIDYLKVKDLDDFVIWNIMEEAQKLNMIIYIHTGLHAWNFNVPRRSHCDSLVTVISKFPNLKFVLLHCSYPYVEDALLLAKYYPNVFLNLTWVCVIDRIKAKEIINRIFEFIPLNKVALFGGDCFHIESVYGHLQIVKEILAQCLFERIELGNISSEKAIEIATMLLGGTSEIE